MAEICFITTQTVQIDSSFDLQHQALRFCSFHSFYLLGNSTNNGILQSLLWLIHTQFIHTPTPPMESVPVLKIARRRSFSDAFLQMLSEINRSRDSYAPGGGGYSHIVFLGGGCRWVRDSPTLYQTKFCKFLTLYQSKNAQLFLISIFCERSR